MSRKIHLGNFRLIQKKLSKSNIGHLLASWDELKEAIESSPFLEIADDTFWMVLESKAQIYACFPVKGYDEELFARFHWLDVPANEYEVAPSSLANLDRIMKDDDQRYPFFVKIGAQGRCEILGPLKSELSQLSSLGMKESQYGGVLSE